MSSARPPMTGPEAGTAGPAPGRERRAWERYQLGGAEGKLIYRHAAMPCRFIDISLGGCCVRTEKRFTDGALAKVEVAFDLHGMPQRMRGITQWTSRENQLGIRFVHATPQDKNQFAALLTGLIDTAAAEAVREAVTAAAAASVAGVPARPPAADASQSAHPPQQACDSNTGDSSTGDSSTIEFEPDESQAVVHFVKDGSEVAGTVVDLSLDGCTLHMVRPFNLGIYVRVEISLHVRGLILQLAGVSQEIHDRHTVAFRFLDVSRRRREELIQIVQEMRAAKKE